MTSATLPESFLAKLPAYREAYARDGVVLVPGVLDAAEQALAREMFEWSRAHPGQSAGEVTLGGPGKTVFIDTHSQHSRAWYLDALSRSLMPAIAAAVLQVDRVWYLGEQVFVKTGEQGSRAPLAAMARALRAGRHAGADGCIDAERGARAIGATLH